MPTWVCLSCGARGLVESGPALLGSPPGTRDLAEDVARSWLESGRFREAVTAAAVRLGGLEAANRLAVPWGWRADFPVMDPATQEMLVSCDGRAVTSIRILHALLAQAQSEGRATVRVETEGPGGVRAWDAAVSDLGSRALDEIPLLRRLEQDF